MTGKRVDLTTCVWGEWHLDVMRRVMWPTLLSPGNLSALICRFPSLYRIATTPADRARIEAWPIFAQLAAAVEIDWITENAAPDITYHLEWYERVLSDAKAKNAYCLMIYPDVAWSNGALARCADAIAAGKAGVAIPYIRVISETFVPDMASRGANSAITLSGRDLVRLGMRHMHPLSVAALAGGRHALPSLDVSWRVPGEGLLLREISRELSLVDTERLQANQYWNVVDTANPESLHVAADSDDMLMLSLAPLFKDFQVYVPNHALSPIDLARVSLHPANNNPFVEYFAAHSIRLHYDRLNEKRWRRFERQADHFIGQALFMREFLRIWNAVHANGCSLASQAMSVGLLATSLADGWRYDGPVTAYIPTDEAFGTWDALAPLLSPGGAGALENFILAHVAPGVAADPPQGSWRQTTLGGAPLLCQTGPGGEFANDARIIGRIELPPHRICIIDRLLAPIYLTANRPKAAPRPDRRTEIADPELDAGDAVATARSRENMRFASVLRERVVKVMDKVGAAASAVRSATFRNGVTERSHGEATEPIDDEDIAQHYPRFLRHFAVDLGDQDIERHKRAAAAALYQAGLYRHKLLFLYDLMTRFKAAAGPTDPHPAFFEYCSSLIGGERDLTRAERYYDLALRLVPDFAEALYALALLKRRADMTTEAIALFEAAAHAPPHPNAVPYAHIAANSWRNLAEILRGTGDDEAAEAYFRNALDHHGIHGVYHAEIAEFLRARGCIADAAREYERVMPYSHLYPSEFSEPNYPPEGRLPFAPDGKPCDPLKPTIVGDDADGRQLVYWWHLYLSIPRGTPFDATSLIKTKPEIRSTPDASAALTNRCVNPE